MIPSRPHRLPLLLTLLIRLLRQTHLPMELKLPLQSPRPTSPSPLVRRRIPPPTVCDETHAGTYSCRRIREQPHCYWRELCRDVVCPVWDVRLRDVRRAFGCFRAVALRCVMFLIYSHRTPLCIHTLFGCRLITTHVILNRSLHLSYHLYTWILS